MKMNKVVLVWKRWLPAVFLMLIATGAFAQSRPGFRNDSTFNALRGGSGRMGLNLTVEQQEQIAALRKANQQEMTDIRNDLAIKRAELQKLRSASEVNRNEVNQKLDEIGQLNTELSKKAFALEEDILNLLTDEQRSFYRSRSGRLYTGLPDRNFNMAPRWREWQGQPFMAPRMGPFRGRR